MYFTLKPKEGTSTSSKEPEQQQVLTANTKSDKPPGLTPQVKDSKQYETSSQDHPSRDINQLESRIIFAAGGAYMPTQEKKKESFSPLTPRHFRRWGGLYAHTRKKKESFSPLGGAYVPTQEKKNCIINFIERFWLYNTRKQKKLEDSKNK